ncbi:hypothetical protein P152DRAFT_65976 [Eremomyces bilateralis CBS 781.70]|uniref:Uncharacterized protein n=1 Tax=Eremomyces bilateralis CBS 781.70 TaxID=1392243 RepID=A0A6G1G075_9PEZI|nr:uncharacterized protein P152DRAFT_65976 [Eremomyces bilateralis CBS 781.70]KAF1811219.1 hypothetical protein P152DRAFT_65976 [Eremomyces bilateralis CBS 781.70]
MERQITPDRPIRREEYTTIQKSRFFEAYDSRTADQPLSDILRKLDLPRRTANYWLSQRRRIGKEAYRRTRPNSDRLGRRRAITSPQLDAIVSSQNPIRELPYEANITHFNLDITTGRALHNNLKDRRDAGRFVEQQGKPVSPRNRRLREDYGRFGREQPLIGY